LAIPGCRVAWFGGTTIFDRLASFAFPRILAFARERVDAVITSAVVFAGIFQAIVDICLAVSSCIASSSAIACVFINAVLAFSFVLTWIRCTLIDVCAAQRSRKARFACA